MLTPEERRLLREVFKWARGNGWTHQQRREDFISRHQWRNAPYALDLHVDAVTSLWLTRLKATGGGSPRNILRPKSIRQALDVLAALGVIPVSFSTAYEVGRKDGVEEGVDSVTEANLWGMVEMELEKLGKSPAKDELAAKLAHRMPETPWEARQMVDEIVTAVGEVLDAS